ncbi:hypothetical protein [Noviherbaspirillum suwonense]|uniref:Uncharacterized protein n=1 Tax=Noviherbaspirillum suwonense TaxID=1224511 RepID=A0ABY1QVS7_9BURK|nr:hypothetical protein [Noviherbaspirillum suwonense]SMP81429.1 hypothetical protein SAMN06295970_1445 [Noviherbaspirillum suwonense]
MSSQAIYFKRANFTASHVFLWLVGAPLLLDGMFSNVAVWNSLGVGISQILLRIIGGIKQFYGGRGRSCFMPFAATFFSS